MNREILFKAKRKDNGEWVEGDLLHTRHGDVVLISDFKDQLFRCDGNTLCQFTGLTDKNGQRIWENDICNRKEKYPEIVTYNEGDWQLDYSYVFGKEIDACNLGFYVCERNCVEVIGNIFDNADLLEVE